MLGRFVSQQITGAHGKGRSLTAENQTLLEGRVTESESLEIKGTRIFGGSSAVERRQRTVDRNEDYKTKEKTFKDKL